MKNRRTRRICFSAVKALFVFGVASTWALAATPATAAKSDPAHALLGQPDFAAQARILEIYGKLPFSFEENRGQTDPHVNSYLGEVGTRLRPLDWILRRPVLALSGRKSLAGFCRPPHI